jgi:hypothetical protein
MLQLLFGVARGEASGAAAPAGKVKRRENKYLESKKMVCLRSTGFSLMGHIKDINEVECLLIKMLLMCFIQMHFYVNGF